MVDPLKAQRLKQFIKQEYGTIREASKDSGRSEQILAKMVRGEIDIQEGVLKNFHRKKRLNINFIYTGTIPMILGEKDMKKSTITDIGELKTAIEYLRSNQSFYKKVLNELIESRDILEQQVKDLRDDVIEHNKEINELKMEIRFLKNQS